MRPAGLDFDADDAATELVPRAIQLLWFGQVPGQEEISGGGHAASRSKSGTARPHLQKQ
jgi:hypothetical protein